MDIFIINSKKADDIDTELLQKFCHKSFAKSKQEKTHSLTYLMLDRILREVYKIENFNIIFDGKKPKLEKNEKNFSVSHSNEYIVIAVSDFDCGIDIEEIKNRDYKKISKRMKFNSDSLESFYMNWTKYEAEYKLGIKSNAIYSFQIPRYTITAASVNRNERFDVFFSL